MARIVLITGGSRGDIQPYIALGKALHAAGHHACLATHAIFREWIEGHGLDFSPVEGDPLAMIQDQSGRDWVETGRRGLGFLRGFRAFMEPILHQATADTLVACRGADLVLFSGIAFYAAYSVCEALGLPFVQAYLQPIHPTRAYPSVVFPSRFRGGGLVNYGTHLIGGQMIWQAARPLLNDIRSEMLGLRPFSVLGPFLKMSRDDVPGIHGYSPTLLPRPHDWPAGLAVTGFWFLDSESYSPPPELTEFLEAGPLPVYIGFGSMTGNNPERLTDIALGALVHSGQRGVLLSGWAGLAQGDLPESILRLDNVPHEWLFPRMAAIVHHGGVGTTHVGLRAGVPSVITPFFADQPFWAERVHTLGVGPRPLPQEDLTAEHLAAAIREAVGSDTMKARAARIGRQVAAEDGLGLAVAVVERYLAQKPRFMDGLKGG